MYESATTASSLRELAYRESDGVEVTLLWDDRHDTLIVSVLDTRTGAFLTLEAARDNALDVFYHPYSYARSEAALSIDPPLAA